MLGHEIAGEIAEVGRDVSDLRVGDPRGGRPGPQLPQRRRTPLCEYCATGDSHQCEHYGEHGITGLQGGLADYLVVPAVNAIRRACHASMRVTRR